jgi:knotted carbamoyltransferase YgeW
MNLLSEKIAELQEFSNSICGDNFLLTWEKSLTEIKAVVLTAEILKLMKENNIHTRIFDSGLAISNFRDNSTRTRYSFAAAANLLGLSVMDLDENKSQIAHGETLRETANMLSFLTEVIGIRDDMYPGLGDCYQREFIDAVNFGCKNNILTQSPTVINLQSDLDHPTQTLADLAKLKNYFGSLNALKNKKIAISWAYSPSYGKPSSVPQGLISLMTRLGMNVALAYPTGYHLMPEIIDMVSCQTTSNESSFNIFHNMEEAFYNADIVYPKSWAPYSILKKRTNLFQNQDFDGLKQLEKECLLQNYNYSHWECNEKMMALTNENSLYMHCLPADISGLNCQKGEVSQNVFNKFMVHTYQQAGYKPYVIAAMILLAKTPNPAQILNHLLQTKKSPTLINNQRQL